MVYIIEDFSKYSEENLLVCFNKMPAERQCRTNQYRNRLDRIQAVLAYKLLVNGLENEYRIQEELTFEYTSSGKPKLSKYPEIHFNLSHCKLAVACAISDKPVGIDVQEIRTYNSRMGRRVCNDFELEQIEKSNNPDLEFCKLWTAKESVVKQSGVGVGCNLKALDLRSVQTEVRGKYIISYYDGSTDNGIKFYSDFVKM